MDGKVSCLIAADFSRLGALQAVTYTVKVVVGLSKKWRETDTLLGLLHTISRKYHMAYLFVPFPMTLKVIRLMHDLPNAIRRTFVRHLARF